MNDYWHNVTIIFLFLHVLGGIVSAIVLFCMYSDGYRPPKWFVFLTSILAISAIFSFAWLLTYGDKT